MFVTFSEYAMRRKHSKRLLRVGRNSPHTVQMWTKTELLLAVESSNWAFECQESEFSETPFTLMQGGKRTTSIYNDYTTLNLGGAL